MEILLIGGSGILGTALRKLNHEIIAPAHDDFDVTCDDLSEQYDIVINAAAIKDNRKIEQDPTEAIEVNVIGAARIAQACFRKNIRYVYISTDYIYKGDRGNYKETDEILPFNLYSWMKLGGECSARSVKNHLIIRTSFGTPEFAYKEAFVDKWVSKDYVDLIAPIILEAVQSPLTGVLNVGTERKTIYDYAIRKNNNVIPVKLSESHHVTPYDNSFNLQKWHDYKSSKPIASPHKNCRVCGSEHLTKYLDLGLMPLANNLELTSTLARQKERFPLQVMFCQECGLSQLSVVIDPDKMFSYYTYRSSINAPFVAHCKKMAEDLGVKYGLNSASSMLDIAGNDGALLNQFRQVLGIDVLNFEPATNLAAVAEAQGIPTITKFWNLQTAIELSRQFDLITATNVFAHVDDIAGFLKGCYHNLKDEGILVLEFPYLVDFIEKMEFDTIYFEHLSYFSLIPLNKLCGQVNLKIIDIEKKDIHGGTVRVTMAKDSSLRLVDEDVISFLSCEQEQGYTSIENYLQWATDVKKHIQKFGAELYELKRQGYKIAAYAASAKGNTLLNAAGINTDVVDYIVDSTPEKIGKYSPGTGIPIKHPSELRKNPPDYVIILSWNFSETLIEKTKALCNAKIIIPIPEFKVK